MRKSLIFNGLFTIIIASIACEEQAKPTTKEVISDNSIKASIPPFSLNPPIQDLTPRFDTLTFDASKGTTFRRPSGTEITIPAHALTDKNGQILRGSVSLQYREFQDALSVYLAGIPMDYKDGHFSTAGSFELRHAEKDENVLFVKPITVKMASFTEGADFNFFKLNDTNGKWDSLGYRKPEINVIKKKLLANRRPTKIEAPTRERNLFAFNYMSIMDVYHAQNDSIWDTSKGMDSAFAGIQNKLAAYDLAWHDCYADNRQVIAFDGYEAPAPLWVWKNLTKKPFPEWARKRDGGYGVLDKISEKRYLLTIESYKDTALKFSTEIEAVMPLKTLFAFSPDDWKNRRSATLAQVKTDQIRIKQMADVYRTFEVNQFGLYNWDKLMKENGRVVVDASFDFQTIINEKLTTLDVVYISGDNRSVITFPKLSWAKMALIPDDKARLFTVLPDQKLAVFTPQQYARLDFSSWQNAKLPPQYLFKMTTQTAKTAADLKRLLHI